MSSIMSKAEAEESSGSLNLTDDNEIHPPQEHFIAFDPNLTAQKFFITFFVTIAIFVLICTTFTVIFKEHGGILILMLSIAAFTVHYKFTFYAWRHLYLSHHLRKHGIASLAKVILTLPYQNKTCAVCVEFPLNTSNGTAVTPIVPGDSDKQDKSLHADVGRRCFIITKEAYNKAIQSQGGIPMLFEAFAKPHPAPAVSDSNDLPHHGIAVPAEGETLVSFTMLIMSTPAKIANFFLIRYGFLQALDASKEDGMEWLLPIFYLLLGIHFIILHWAFWTAVTGHAGLEYKYRKSKSADEWNK